MKQTTIYFSYAWRDASNKDREKLVDDLYNTLTNDNYSLKRDKKDLGFGESISAFMKEIGEADLILVFTSAKYLKSEYCMWELYEIFRNSRLDKNILQKRVLIFNAEFVALNRPAVRKEYLKYWSELEAEWKDVINMSNATKSDREQYDKIRTISLNFGDLASFIQDINASNDEILSADNFAIVKTAIDKRITELKPNTDTSTDSKNIIKVNGSGNVIIPGSKLDNVTINVNSTNSDKKIGKDKSNLTQASFRNLMKEALSKTEIEILLKDHFESIFRDFEGEPKAIQIEEIINYCKRKGTQEWLRLHDLLKTMVSDEKYKEHQPYF